MRLKKIRDEELSDDEVKLVAGTGLAGGGWGGTVEPKKEDIATLDLPLGREDLNTLVAKVNEIIERINK